VLEKPEEVVGWLGAVQAQDYGGAKWALGLRLQGATDDDVEKAFTDGSILRTHLMRPTWHFVTPADIRWLLALTAPRVHALNQLYYRKLELDQAIFNRSTTALENALHGGKQLTREQLRQVFHRAGISTQGEMRMGYLMMCAELNGIVCSGGRRGKQFTYMLLDDRAPQARILARDESLAELAKRYFVSHGPATAQDFAWWSGLTVADARSGIEMVISQLIVEVIDGSEYWFSDSMPSAIIPSPAAYLLPNYDEYGSYKDRSAIFEATKVNKLVFGHLIAIDGRIAGTWKRTLKKDTIVIETNTFAPLNEAEREAVATAARRYGAFLGLPVSLQ
jgi:hypothetical protein